MRSAFWRGVALLAVGILVLPAAMNTDAQALNILSEAGRAAAAGSNMHDSTARLFDLFPHLMVGGGSWVEVVSEEYDDDDSGSINDSSPAMGRCALAWNDFIIGCSLSNPANGALLHNAAFNGSAFMVDASGLGLLGESGGTSKTTNWPGLNPFSGGEFFTGVFAMPAGEGAAAFTLGVYLDKNNSSSDAGEVNNPANGFAFGASWGNGDNVNVAGQFTIFSGENENTISDPAVTRESSANNLALYGEFDMDDMNRLYGAFTFGSATSTDQDDDGDDEASGFAVLGGWGRTLAESDDQIVTGEMFMAFVKGNLTGTTGADADPIPETDTTNLWVPGARVVGRHQLSDRYSLTASAHGYWSSNKTEVTSGDPATTSESTNSGFVYDWYAGLQGEFGPLTIDAYLQTDNLGYLLSLGNDYAMVGGISGTATF